MRFLRNCSQEQLATYYTFAYRIAPLSYSHAPA